MASITSCDDDLDVGDDDLDVVEIKDEDFEDNEDHDDDETTSASDEDEDPFADLRDYSAPEKKEKEKERKVSPPPRTSRVKVKKEIKEESDEEMEDSPQVIKTKLVGGREKIVFDDDNDIDDAYEKFRASKEPKRGRPSTKAKGKRRADRPALRPPQKQVKTETSKKDEDIPEYIQKRRNKFDDSDVLRLPPSYEDIEFSDDDNLEHLEERPQFFGSAPCRNYEDIIMDRSGGIIPASIAQRLRDYQVEGVRFLHKKFVYQTGAILGDDMGLGKTVQVISFLTAAFGKTGDERDKKRMRKMRRAGRWYPRVLIVCPLTLMDNWQREFDTWGWWTTARYHGGRKEKEQALEAVKNGYIEIMITTYKSYMNDMDRINDIEWDAVVADECHQIKEPKAQITQAMAKINSLCRIGLTGTAIMNNYTELWVLLNWILPGDVGTKKEWKQEIEEPLKQGQSHAATNGQLALARLTAKKLTQKLLPRMFLRRMKTLIAHQLPKKTDKVVFCPLTDFQQEVYEAFLETEEVQLVKYSGDLCDCGEPGTRGTCCYRTTSTGLTVKEVMFPCIQNLLSLCNHFNNWIPQAQDNREKRDKELDRLQQVCPDKWEFYYRREQLLNAMDPDFCGKWLVLKKLLAFWHEAGDKVLVFSYSRRLLKTLAHLFEMTKYNSVYLDGEMAAEERTNAVDSFNSDPSIFTFLISTRAGGVGLNITSANKVVVFDPSWNPAHDLQAQDRAYRIGQTRDVEVFRLVSCGTIEVKKTILQGTHFSIYRRKLTAVHQNVQEIVYARQIYKQQQANIGYQASFERRYFTGVMKDKTKKGELFGLKNLFTFQQDNVVLQEIVKKTNVAESRTGVAILGMDSQLDMSMDGEEDDDPLSQIQAIVTGESGKNAKKLDPVQAILSEAGVEYTHNNAELLGNSKIEENISRRALEGRDDSAIADGTAFRFKPEDDERYQFGDVPTDVAKRQFRSMRKYMKFEKDEDFAFKVEGWSAKERSEFLDQFYRMRRATVLSTLGEV